MIVWIMAKTIIMDREITKEERRRVRNKMIARAVAVAAVVIILLWAVISALGSSVRLKDLELSTVDRGSVEVSVSASGRVVPAFEEVINSPIGTRIVKVFARGGDMVDEGTPIMELDLQSTETDYRKMLDEEQMKRLQLRQLRIDNRTYLSDLEMKVKISAMRLDRMDAELRNERYLDSIGSGTTDKVRQAELAYNTGRLELEQLRQMYRNERQVKDADLKVKELELQIFSKNIGEMRRTLEDARIRSPRKAVLTYINNKVGARIASGEQVAVVSDLSHFKVDCEVADSYAERVSAGRRAVVRIGSSNLTGIVSSVTPLSRNGVISFTVQLDDDSSGRLRSGLKTDVYVMDAVKVDVMRIANASYYVGPGDYNLFVMDGSDRLVRRSVRLGESNFEFVEVVEGLKPGDRVVISSMNEYKNKKSIRLER